MVRFDGKTPSASWYSRWRRRWSSLQNSSQPRAPGPTDDRFVRQNHAKISIEVAIPPFWQPRDRKHTSCQSRRIPSGISAAENSPLITVVSHVWQPSLASRNMSAPQPRKSRGSTSAIGLLRSASRVETTLSCLSQFVSAFDPNPASALSSGYATVKSMPAQPTAGPSLPSPEIAAAAMPFWDLLASPTPA